MKASEMTNEELVSVLAEIPCKPWHDLDRETVHDTCREAAARLRNTTVREMAHRAAVESYKREVKDLNSKRQATIRDLRLRLKVAEEALRHAIGVSCASCKSDCDGCLNLKSGWMKGAKDALSAIREGGGARISEEMAKPNLCRSCANYKSDGCQICGCADYEKVGAK